MSRAFTVTGSYSDLRIAAEAECITVEPFNPDIPQIGAALIWGGRRIGAIQSDPISHFGDATMTIDTGWCDLEVVLAVLKRVGR